MKTDFNVLFLEEALLFYDNLDEQVKTKVVYNIQRCRKVADAKDAPSGNNQSRKNSITLS